MKHLLPLITTVAVGSALFGRTHADDALIHTECYKSAEFFAPMGSPGDGRKYAPDREVQILHLAIDVTPDFAKRTITGKTIIHFKPLTKPLHELKLDAVDLNVHSVEATEPIQAYQVTDTKVIVTFAAPIQPEEEVDLTVTYSAEPKKGLYFRTPEMGYKPGDTHLFTQGEAIEARHWYPCLDSPNMKFTSEVTCHVTEGMVAISNGRLVSETKDPVTGLVAIHWSQEKPHANYLITLVAGYLKKLEDRAGDIPLAFYTPPSEIQAATNSFRTTKDTMEFFNQEIGVPYPWPKYDQICVNDFVEGGMENTSATTLTDYTLFTDATENIRDSEGLISHEMAHQWFGDLVTCKDWSHTWLNEGFATYYESLYNAHKNGRDSMLYELYGRARMITGISNDTTAIVRRDYSDPNDMFTYLSYPKASWVLHMLRSQLGEDLYRRCIKTYLERHAFGSVVTEDLRQVIEELSGRSFDRFFDQWLYHGHHPELEVAYSWDERTRLARLTVRQTQQLGANVLLFDLPLTVRFSGRFGTTNCPLHVAPKEDDFYFPLPSAPQVVRLDPEYTVLARTTFSLPVPMLTAQLADKSDVMGRLLALEQLAGKPTRETVTQLKQALNNDPFYGVRVEAALALRSVHTDDALEALLASTNQPDARVRLQVMNAIGGFYEEKAYAADIRALDQEKNPDILSAEIRALAGYSKPEVRTALEKYLGSESFRNELAVAAVRALRQQDDPAAISLLIETLKRREREFTSRGLAEGLGALAYLGRNEEKKQTMREYLIGYVNSPKSSVRLASLSALGTLGDSAAIPVLEKYATAAKETPERTSAERALTQLRAARRPAEEVNSLRQEVLELQKTNRQLRKDLDALQKKFEAAVPEPASSGKRTKKPAVTPPKHS